MKSKNIHWTFHARDKMRFYRLSEQRVRGVIHSPKRTEEGIAPKTVAVMSPVSVRKVVNQGSGKVEENWKQEIWVMFQDKKSMRTIISAWRYPGKTRPRSETSQDLILRAYNEFMKSKGE